jgi:hypothetical protein
MNSLKLVLLTATIMLAMAFTFSCSSGDNDENPSPSNGGGSSSSGGNSGVDMSGLPTQVYLDGMEYMGNDDIALVYDNSEAEVTIPSGKIENGQIKLALPEIESKYLIKFEAPLSYPNDLYTSKNAKIYAIINDESYELTLKTIEAERIELVFVYSSKSGKVKGSYDDNGATVTYDCDFSKGWNAIWAKVDFISFNFLLTSSRPQGIGELKWIAEERYR